MRIWCQGRHIVGCILQVTGQTCYPYQQPAGGRKYRGVVIYHYTGSPLLFLFTGNKSVGVIMLFQDKYDNELDRRIGVLEYFLANTNSYNARRSYVEELHVLYERRDIRDSEKDRNIGGLVWRE